MNFLSGTVVRLEMCVLLMFMLCGRGVSSTYTAEDSAVLRRALFSNYSQLDRPKSQTRVKIIFHLLTVNHLDIRAMSFAVTGRFFMTWNDYRLSWNTSQYNNIGYIYATENEVWNPPVIVGNAISDIHDISNKKVPFRVVNKGKVFWHPPGIYETQCDIKITYYPFDTQRCNIILKTVGYTLREIDLILYGNGIETAGYEKNGEWDLIDTSASRSEINDTNDAEIYPTITVTFTLKRRPLYYGMNIILPTFVLSVLSAVVFILPADSGEKMGYSLTVLLSITVFLTIVSNSMPTTSQDTSIMAVYISMVLLLSGTSVLLTTLVLDLYFRDKKQPIPNWMQILTKCCLVRFACASACCTTDKVKDISHFPNHIHGSDVTEWTDSSRTHKVTWKEVSKALDAFFFRLHLIVYISFTVAIFIVLGL